MPENVKAVSKSYFLGSVILRPGRGLVQATLENIFEGTVQRSAATVTPSGSLKPIVTLNIDHGIPKLRQKTPKNCLSLVP